MSGPLSGIRVIDLTAVVMGPFATQILGDQGADVIKVEAPEGDVFRYVTPFRHEGMSAAFLNLNRNKRSIALDLKQATDKQVMLDLLKTADVFVTTVRPQAMRKLGLDFESVRTLNPRLIYCGAYGFSETGPYAGRPAFDDIIQAMSGLAELQGRSHPDGPQYAATIFADKTVGITVAYAVAMALYERERSGLGQFVEVPMFETMVAFTMVEHLAGETFCPPEGGTGYERLLSEHRRPYRTKDGFIGLLPYTTKQWQNFFTVAGKPEMIDDPRVTDPTIRGQNVSELYRMVTELIAERTTEEWVAQLSAVDVPITPVLSPDDLLHDEHLQALNFFPHEQHPSEGEIRAIGIPVHFARTPGDIRHHAPQLDEQRAEILQELRETQKNDS